MSLAVDRFRSSLTGVLVKHVRGKVSPVEDTYPWRKGWQFVVHHSLRAEAYAVEMMQTIFKTNPSERLPTRASSILHDNGRLDVQEMHGLRGAEIIMSYVSNGILGILSEFIDVSRLLSIVENHSEKEEHESDLVLAVVKDADTLDEIGAFSILMNAEHANRTSHLYFHELSKLLDTPELDFCKKKRESMNTKEGRHILDTKIRFLGDFITQLKYEMSGTIDLDEEKWT